MHIIRYEEVSGHGSLQTCVCMVLGYEEFLGGMDVVMNDKGIFHMKDHLQGFLRLGPIWSKPKC